MIFSPKQYAEHERSDLKKARPEARRNQDNGGTDGPKE
jgi:hypothetical protein